MKTSRRPRPLTDGYVRQTLLQRLRKLGIEEEDITPEMMQMERVKLESVRTLRKLKKWKESPKEAQCQNR